MRQVFPDEIKVDERHKIAPPIDRFRIANLEHIERVWGASAKALVVRAIQQRIIEMRHAGTQLDVACEQLCTIPVMLDDEPVHAVVVDAQTIPIVPTPVGLLPEDDLAAEVYKADMRLAASAFQAAKEGRLRLMWQPVVDVRTQRVFYHEVLLRFSGVTPTSPSRFIGALERLGMAQMLDSLVLARVLLQLRTKHSVVLSANISAQSAFMGSWQRNLIEYLQAHPEIASRLVLEITESTALPSLLSTKNFIAAIRSARCRVAIDDFGAGHTSIETMLALEPDIVKLDGQFIRHATVSQVGFVIFSHVIGLAAASTPIVVIEGVESPDQAALAQGAGGWLQQGYLHGRPEPIHAALIP